MTNFGIIKMKEYQAMEKQISDLKAENEKLRNDLHKAQQDAIRALHQQEQKVKEAIFDREGRDDECPDLISAKKLKQKLGID